MENHRALLLRLISTFIQQHCPCFAHEDLEQAAQQNGAIRDKDFACEGLSQKTGKQLIIPRSKLEDKHDGSRLEGKDDGSIEWETSCRTEEQTRGQTRWQLGQGLFLRYLACQPLPTTEERSSSLHLRRMDETL